MAHTCNPSALADQGKEDDLSTGTQAWVTGWDSISKKRRMLNIGLHSLLACRVSAEIPAVSLMGFPLWVTWLFSLKWRTFSLHFNLGSIWWLCVLGVALPVEYLCSFWIWMLACLARLGKFSWIISWRVFSNLVPFSPSLSVTPIKRRFGLYT